MKTKSLKLLLAFTLSLIVVSGFAFTWQQVNPMQQGSLGMSADGRIICAIPPNARAIISTNSGSTWNTITTNLTGDGFVGGTAVSGDGSKIFGTFVTNFIRSVFISTNFGATWTRTAFPRLSFPAVLACSADGMTVVAAISDSGIYYSTNAGVNCNTSSAPAVIWSTIASSADGGQMVAAAVSGSVYFSQDFAATWAPTNLPSQNWNTVCVSSDGKWVGAISSVNSYISSNSGVTWQTNMAGRAFACSANGTCWLIGGTQQIYTSTDNASTWQTNLSAGPWYSGAVSADGCQMIAIGSSAQGIQLGRLTPSPQLNIQSQDPNVSISWLIPSTNFVLQQSSDVSNPAWTPVSINPTLNFTNLNQQVTVPGNGSNAIFRLSAQ